MALLSFVATLRFLSHGMCVLFRIVSERVKIGWRGSVAGGRGQQKEVYVHSFRFFDIY